MIAPDDAFKEFAEEFFEKEYKDVVIYGDFDEDEVLHEGPIRIQANGWIELPAGRLISPTAIHHLNIIEK
ncbi:hypothetical protein [Haladaptatus sp. DYF46]|uniref:hypothetical protein n=1 Tax=Haladaptatus sp. DYF46 TaxID=2886041 RepID=UPI001E31CB33|nr:hypothetical protein [Haladaptatus sp. DYF46]